LQDFGEDSDAWYESTKTPGTFPTVAQRKATIRAIAIIGVQVSFSLL